MTDQFRAMCAELVAIEDALSGGSVQFSNQGQALDGYSALATFRDVADRARALLAEAVPEVPTDQEIARFLADRYRERMDNQSAFGCPDFDGSKAKAAQIADARAVLSRWGRPTARAALAAEPVGEGPINWPVYFLRVTDKQAREIQELFEQAPPGKIEPLPAAAPAPEPGEVAELVADLNEIAQILCGMEKHRWAAKLTSAATLLQQQAAPAHALPLPAPEGGEVS